MSTAIDTDAGRHYADPAGRLFPAVSTVLEATAGKRWGLDTWRRNLGEDAAEQVADIARARGHVLHREIVAYLRTGETPARPSVWWRSVLPVIAGLRGLGQVVLAEQSLVHPLDGFGGTPDLVLRIGRRLVVYDWKTSAEPRPLALLVGYEDQLAAYCDLVAYELGERPTHALDVVALPEQVAQVHPVPLDVALPRWRGRLADYQLAA